VTRYIDTARLSQRYREVAVDVPGRRILISQLGGSDQEADLTMPANCAGLGRIRHFRRHGNSAWGENPLPIDPAAKALGLPPDLGLLRAQVFQNAVCNWRCWYCFVPFNLLKGDPNRSQMVTAEALIDLYIQEPSTKPRVIDLSGGQPELVPEWTLWMMQELQRRKLDETTYLWSDDNLSSDHFWTELKKGDRAVIANYPNYGRVCCFKGFDESSFSFNTGAAPNLYSQQFERFARLLDLGIDLYAYVTFTSPPNDYLRAAVSGFVDRLQQIHPLLPLRTVPLEVAEFGAMTSRVTDSHRAAIDLQHEVNRLWLAQLRERFDEGMRATNITSVRLA
jgi:uncharacterized Fe-S cluster-containing radical SAM superfamily protein